MSDNVSSVEALGADHPDTISKHDLPHYLKRACQKISIDMSGDAASKIAEQSAMPMSDGIHAQIASYLDSRINEQLYERSGLESKFPVRGPLSRDENRRVIGRPSATFTVTPITDQSYGPGAFEVNVETDIGWQKQSRASRGGKWAVDAYSTEEPSAVVKVKWTRDGGLKQIVELLPVTVAGSSRR